MTITELQQELVDEMKVITKDIYFKNPDGEQSELNIFKQNLPFKQSDEDTDPYPYCIVRINNGANNGIDIDENNIRALLIFGIYDNDPSNQGHQTILEIIQRTIERFSKNNVLKTFAQTGNIEWALDDDESFPYFFGGVDLTFIPMMPVRRESMFT